MRVSYPTLSGSNTKKRIKRGKMNKDINEELAWWSYQKKKGIMEGDMKYVMECTQAIKELMEVNSKVV